MSRSKQNSRSGRAIPRISPGPAGKPWQIPEEFARRQALANRSRRRPSGVVVRWFAAIALAATLVASAPARVWADDDERVEQFLARLGLTDLQILQREQRLQTTQGPAARLQLARGLADLYAERLMSSGDDAARYAELTQRVERLLRDFPQADTSALKVMLAQADYNRAESFVTTWMNNPQDTAARQQAVDVLARIAPLLAQLDRELDAQAESLQAEIDRLPDGDVLQEREAQWKRVRGIAGRALYFAAWCHYYLGLTGDTSTQAAAFAQARELFRRALGLEAGLPDGDQAEWLGLESIWRARALMGLGLSEAACGDINACDRCFQLLEQAGVPTEIQDQAPAWHLRAILQAGQHDRALALARRRIADYRPPATQGQVSLCVALVREGWGNPGVRPTKVQQALGQLGLHGLARLGQTGPLETLIDRFRIPADDPSSFVLQWIAGQRQFADADKAGTPEAYAAAARTLEAALAAPDAGSLAGPASRCRYTLAWCYYRQRDFERAATEFNQAHAGLAAAGDRLAVEAIWMSFVAYQQLIATHPRFVTAATESLQRLQRTYPDHPYAQRAERELARLAQQHDPEALARHLESVPATDPNYAQARYELCLLRHRLWGDRKRAGAGAGAALTALQQAADAFLKSAAATRDATRCLKCSLLVADAALQSDPPESDMARAALERAERWTRDMPSDSSLLAEYHYRRLQLATAAGDQAARGVHAQWLSDQAAGSPYELPALMIVANARDQEAADGGTPAVEQCYTLYQRIVRLLETGDGAPSRNLALARSRLAYYASRSGRHDEAAAILDQLLATQPGERQWVRRAGEAYAAAGNHQQALIHWRTLLQGLPKGSESWYEAKFQQLQSLAQVDRDQARKVYQQFALLYPDLGGDAWRDKFVALTRRW